MAKKYDLNDDDVFDPAADPDDEKLDRMLDEIAELRRTIGAMPGGDDTDPVGLGGYDDPAASDGYDSPAPAPEEDRFEKTTRRLKSDILRLSDRIDDLSDERESLAYGGGREGAIDRLVIECGELVRRTAAIEKKLDGDLAAIRRRLAELNTSGIDSTVNEISESLGKAREMIVGVNDSLESLSSRVGGESKQPAPDAEVLRQIYDLKRAVGSPSLAAVRRNDELLGLYDLLAKVRAQVGRKSLSAADKFAAIDELASRLRSTSECDIAPITAGLNALIDELLGMPLTRKDADALDAYAGSGPMPAVDPVKLDNVRSYLGSVAKYAGAESVGDLDDLPDIIALKNEIQQNRNEFALEAMYSALLNCNIAYLGEKDPARKRALAAEMKEKLDRLVVLEVRDLVSYPKIELEKPFKSLRRGDGESLFDKLSGAVFPSAPAGEAAEPVGPADEEGEPQRGFGSLESLSRAIMDVKSECLNILDRIDEKKEYEAEESGAYSGTAVTLDETIAQLDRLFEDVKSLATDSENNIISSLAVLGEGIARLSEHGDEAAADRRKLLDDVALIRAHLEGGIAPAEGTAEESAEETEETAPAESAEEVPAPAESAEIIPSENGNMPTIEKRIEAVEKNQAAIVEALERLDKHAEENANSIKSEIKLLREQLFAVTMANVSDGEGEGKFESYNHLLLDELYSLGDSVEGGFKRAESGMTALRSDMSSALKKCGAAMPAARPGTKRPPAKKTGPKRKKAVPLTDSDASINEIISEIRNTDVSDRD